jgi:glycine cleavage system H protein
LKAKDYEIPEDLLYTKEHEWARVQADAVVIGITEYAAKTLNDIVYVSLPQLGDNLKQFVSFGTVESIKAVSELYSPYSGVVTRVNAELNTHPELTNQSPYGSGWLLELKPKDIDVEKKNLLSPVEYAKHVDSMK